MLYIKINGQSERRNKFRHVRRIQDNKKSCHTKTTRQGHLQREQINEDGNEIVHQICKGLRLEYDMLDETENNRLKLLNCNFSILRYEFDVELST